MSSLGDLMTLKETAEYGHVTRQAIYSALKKKLIKGEKIGNQWFIKKVDYDAYRMGRHNIMNKRIAGNRIYNEDGGMFPVIYAARMLGEITRSRFTTQRVYYMIRCGRIRAHRIGTAWMIKQEDIDSYLEKRQAEEHNDSQTRFA
jgi:excisionase family DNA binding protein